MKLAIDFGTTNTVIARWDDSVQIVALPGLSATPDAQSLVPSLVYVSNGHTGEAVIGQAVRERQLDRQPDNRLFRNFKRGIISVPGPAPRRIDGALWADRDAGEVFLRALLAAMPPGRVDQLVLTAPVTAFEGYLSWLAEVLGDLASQQVYIVDESTAAALGYAVTEPGAPVLVFDFGGGTLDLSLVQLPNSRETTGGILSRLRRGSAARVIAKAGRVIGGSDIDHWLLAWALKQVGLSQADLGANYTTLLTHCEAAKIRLSSETAASIPVEISGQVHQIRVTRAELENLLASNGFYDALRHIVDTVMHVSHRSHIYREDVHYVLLVGGVSLMPSVQALLRDYFGEAAVRAEKPFTAVAEGALQVALGYGLDDYLNQSYGLRYLDPLTGQHRYDEIIPMGSRYPTDKPVEVELGAAHEGQNAVEFVIGEIGGESTSMIEVRYEGGQTVFIAQADAASDQIVPLNEDSSVRVRLDPPGRPGERRLRASFGVDEQRHLRATVTDLRSRHTLLKDADIAALGKSAGPRPPAPGTITGSEPRLADRPSGQRRLSLRSVATLLNALPPEAVSLEAAEAALRSSSFQARYNAATALSKRGDRDARRIMQQVLTDGSPPARASVARHLTGFTWYAVQPLVRQALADTDSRVREAVMYALCGQRDLHAYQLMAEVLETEADNVRSAAVYGLRDRQDAAAVPALRAALRAHDSQVRVKALEALSNNDSPQALPVVRAALTDVEPDVQYAAALSLLELARESALDELVELIRATQAESRATILRALFHATNYLNINPAKYAGVEALLEALEIALEDSHPGVRSAAIWPLAWMRSERANALLSLAYRREADGNVRAHIVRVTVNLMAPVGEALLCEALDSPDPVVRQIAEEIMDIRSRVGEVGAYDESAARGTGLAKPSRVRP